MTEGVKLLRFFLGANSPRGFVSRFDQLERQKDGWNTYIIKGGPGTGKSTLMKDIAAEVPRAGDVVEEIYCSSDCASLDGLILHRQRVSVADGTPPHTLEPRCPGAYDTAVNLGDCWDEDALRAHRAEIMDLCARISSLHAQSTRFLAAFSALSEDNWRIAREHTDEKKVAEYARRFAAREMKPRQAAEPHEDVRFLSAICDKGVVVREDTACALAQRIFVLDDPWGASSRLLLGEVRRLALARGYDIVSCYCPADPLGKLEHLFIPELSIGLMTSNRVHPLALEPYRIIHARRFTDMEAMRRKKQRLAFNRRAAAEMLAEACACIAAAKELHDALEAFYTGAMDFSRLAEKRAAVLARLQNL